MRWRVIYDSYFKCYMVVVRRGDGDGDGGEYYIHTSKTTIVFGLHKIGIVKRVFRCYYICENGGNNDTVYVYSIRLLLEMIRLISLPAITD